MMASFSKDRPRHRRDSSTGALLWGHPQSNACIVAGSVGIYWFFVSLIPVYNKFFFDKTQYPYPIASAGIQLGLVSLLLAVFNVARHFVRQIRHNTLPAAPEQSTTTMTTTTIQTHSWLMGPGFWYKIQWTAPIGILFGLKYGVTNLGLALVPAPTHLLLQSTDLIWTCLAAWFIKDERLHWVGYACIGGCIIGSTITSYTTVRANDMTGGDAFESSSWWAILVNLLSPMLLGMCITTLRVACKRLLIPNNPNLHGTTMDASELTCLKLVMSSSVALCLAWTMEGQVFLDGDLVRENWCTAFGKLASSTQLGVSMGSLLILVFQVNCTYLTNLTSAYAVGLVGQLKIIPQWLTAALIAPPKTFHLQAGNILGAIITMIAAAVFAIYNYHQSADAPTTASMEAPPSDIQPPEKATTVGSDQIEKLWLLGAGSGMDSPEMMYGSTTVKAPHHQSIPLPGNESASINV